MLENQHSRYGAIAKNLPLTLGKIFFVVNDEDTFSGDMVNEFPVDRDGVPRVYAASNGSGDTAIQAALDACVANRNDYVIIMPSSNNYDISAQITMSKRNVHLISPEAINPTRKCGGSNAVKLNFTIADHGIYVTGDTNEIAGFYFKNYSNKSSIEGGTSAHCCHIHHNFFNMTGSSTSGAGPIDFTAGGANFVMIENNVLMSNANGVTFTGALIYVAASCTGSMVCNNRIIVGNENTVAYGIRNEAYKGMTHENHISAVAAGASNTTSTITRAIRINAGAANGNFMNVSATEDVMPSTLTEGFVGNWSGATGGAAASQAS